MDLRCSRLAPTTRNRLTRNSRTQSSSTPDNRVAKAVLDAEALDAEVRNRIQELWDGQGPVILERTRRTLAAALDIDDLVVDNARFQTALERW